VPDYAEVLTRGVSGIRGDIEFELRDRSLSAGEKTFLRSLLEVCDGVCLYQSRCCRVLETEAGRTVRAITATTCWTHFIRCQRGLHGLFVKHCKAT